MAYCGPRGIPHSVFLGRVARPGIDPEWLQSDRDDALAWQVHENQRCRGCGTHPEDWAEDKFAYHAHFQECVGCRQRDRLANSDDAQKKKAGWSAVLSHGPATACARCKPVDLAADDQPAH